MTPPTGGGAKREGMGGNRRLGPEPARGCLKRRVDPRLRGDKGEASAELGPVVLGVVMG